MISIDIQTPDEVALDVACKVKARRLELNLTQEGLCKRAGLKLPTYRKFERTGAISFKGLLKIAFVFDAFDEFEALFTKRQYASIDEVIAQTQIVRKRGHKN